MVAKDDGNNYRLFSLQILGRREGENELQDVKSLNSNYIDRSNSNNRKRALPIYEIRIIRPQEL